MSENDKAECAKVISVRLDSSVYKVIESLANEYGTSKSIIVRLALDQALEKYLGSVRYIDQRQAKKINHNIVVVGNMLEDIRKQIRMLGINLNPIAKARNAIKKNSLTYDEYLEILGTTPDISKNDIVLLSKQFDDVITKVGDIYVYENTPQP